MDDVDERVNQLKSVIEKAQVVEVPDSLRQQLSELRLEYERLKSHGDAITAQLTESLAERQPLLDSLLTAKLWIEGKELEIQAGKTLPLMSVDAQKALEDGKVALTHRVIHYVYVG